MKKLGCLASALLLTFSLASVTYAQRMNSDLTAALKAECLNGQLGESSQNKMVIEYLVYDNEGKRVEDARILQLLEESESDFSIARGPVIQTCCDSPSYETLYQEWHFYQPPTPASCTYERIEAVVCRNCSSIYSKTSLGTFEHTHR